MCLTHRYTTHWIVVDFNTTVLYVHQLTCYTIPYLQTLDTNVFGTILTTNINKLIYYGSDDLYTATEGIILLKYSFPKLNKI